MIIHIFVPEIILLILWITSWYHRILPKKLVLQNAVLMLILLRYRSCLTMQRWNKENLIPYVQGERIYADDFYLLHVQG